MKKFLGLFVLALLVLMGSQARADVVGSTVAESSHVLRTGSGTTLVSLLTSYHTAAYRALMLFDSDAVPANGSTTGCPAGVANHTKGCMAYCVDFDIAAAAAGFTFHSFIDSPLPFQWGVVVVASTNASGCTSLTADGANEWFNAQVGP